MTATTLSAASQEARPAWLEPRASYIHVPFCAHKCGYCDFASVAHAEDRIDEYLDALETELRSILGSPRAVETIFVGGGTPTYLSGVQLRKLLQMICRWFPLKTVVEFTVESNPNTLDPDKTAALADAGVNRVSLGAQSFHPRLLAVLERNHDPESVFRAVEMLQKRPVNLSIDLIFGAPGQTLHEFESDLEKVIALKLQHCSAYGLMYEKGTPLWRQRQLGVVEAVTEDVERAMYEHAVDRLSHAGLVQYEISNFARGAGQGGAEDGRCRHNLVYWANHAYFGFGTGAAAYVDGTRTLNTRELGAYIKRCQEGRSPVTQSETLLPEERARETAMLQLRRRDGIDRAAFAAQTGFSIDELGEQAIRTFVRHGLLEDDGAALRLTRAGLLVADGVLRSLL